MGIVKNWFHRDGYHTKNPTVQKSDLFCLTGGPGRTDPIRRCSLGSPPGARPASDP